jgi:HSP90 family molecular chaperone
MPALDEKRNITLRLSRQTIQKARVLAAQRSTSISGLLTSQIEQLAESEDDYERAMKRAMARMEKGFHMGEIPKFDRDALHER